MKILYFIFLCLALTLSVHGQNKLKNFDELPEAPNAADWIFLWDTSADISVKVSPANFFKAMPVAGLSTIGGVKRNAGAAGEFVAGIDASGNLVYGTPAGSGGGISITGTRVPYGNGSGSLTSEGGFEYNATSNVLSAPNILLSGEVRLGTDNIVLGSYTPGHFTLSEFNVGDEIVIDMTVDNNPRVYSGSGVGTLTFDSIDVAGPVEAYGPTWNGSAVYATKDAVYDKIEAYVSPVTATHVPYGSGAGLLTSEATFTYDAASDLLSVTNATIPSLRLGTNTFTLSSPVNSVLSLDAFSGETIRIGLETANTVNVTTTTGVNRWNFPNTFNVFAGGFEAAALSLYGDFGASSFKASIGLDPALSADRSVTLTIPDSDVQLTIPGSITIAGRADFTGSQSSPNTTTPLSPTWTGETHVVRQGITGTIVLPLASGYNNRALMVDSYGSYTVTVDPTGTEHIFENGVSLGAGVADVTAMTAGQTIVYISNGTSWRKLTGGSGGVSAWADLTDVPTNLQNLEDATDPGADRLWGWDESGNAFGFFELGSGFSISGNTISAPGYQQTGSFNGTDTYDANTRYSGTMSADATLTLSLTNGQSTGFELDVTGATRTLTFTPAYRVGYSGGTVTTLAIPVGRHRVNFYHNGTNYIVADSVTEAITALNGSWASPDTTATEDIDFTNETYIHVCGANQVLNLPTAVGYGGRGLVVRFDGSYTATFNPDGTETVDLNGTATSAGEAVVATGTAGQLAIVVSDGTSWAVMGGSASYAEETP